MQQENKNVSYSFQKVEHPKMLANDRVLVCPVCREVLMRADIEGFSSCPFCSYKFENTYELEDFIMEPLVDKLGPSSAGVFIPDFVPFVFQRQGIRPVSYLLCPHVFSADNADFRSMQCSVSLLRDGNFREFEGIQKRLKLLYRFQPLKYADCGGIQIMRLLLRVF